MRSGRMSLMSPSSYVVSDVVCDELRWSAHPQVSALRECLNYIKYARPLSGLVENVMGFSKCNASHTASPEQLFLQQLEKMDYKALSFRLCLSSWVHATRPRRFCAT